MAVKPAQVSVTTAATRVSSDETDRYGGERVAILPTSSLYAVVDGPTGTYAAGAQVAANTAISVDLDPGEDLYVASSGGSITLHVLRAGI